MTTKKRLALSIGCPSGIGPEVGIAAVAKAKGVRALLVGDVGVLRRAARAVDVDSSRVVEVASAEEGFRAKSSVIPVLAPLSALAATDARAGRPSRAGGAAQLAWIDVATDLVRDGFADALVTGPVNKDVIASSGAPGSRGFRGHTEHLAERLGAPEVTMAFATERLVTSLVTTHLPLARVANAITSAEVARAVFWTALFIATLVRKKQRSIVVAALNPHAGEGGLLGHEESRVIAPGIRKAEARLAKSDIDVRIVGPMAAESAFRHAASGGYDAVVAMYHDQATIPMKLLGFGEAVNVSLGLPIVRTSVDHGTAYDRAGKGTADARGMIEAIHLAARLAGQK